MTDNIEAEDNYKLSPGAWVTQSEDRVSSTNMRSASSGLWLLPILATLSGAARLPSFQVLNKTQEVDMDTDLVVYGFSPREKRSVDEDEIRFELLIA